MNFRITYNDARTAEPQSVGITAPSGSTKEDCIRIVGFAASNYGVDMSTLKVEIIPERVSKGFLHPIMAHAKGYDEPIPITRWYF
jgi:hypothetical protein